MSFLSNLALGLCLMTPVVSFAQAVEMCDVPVCSIQDTIAQMRSMTADQRGMYALSLKNTHKDATDQKVLENLYQASMEMKALVAELKDADWIQRAASDLFNTTVLNLAKHSEVDGARMGHYYTELTNATSRYALISHWQTKLSTEEDVDVLKELIIFADAARTHSAKISDEDWIPRAATSLISEITIKLTNLDPAHEGLYDVTVHSNKGIDALAFDRIAVLDSSSSKNLVVALINTRLRVIVHTFSQAEIMGNTVTGLALSNGEMATKLSLTLDRQTGDVDGTIQSTRHGVTKFSGRQLVSTRSVFAGTAPRGLSSKDVLGTMRGELAGVQGHMTINSFKENVYSATFISDTGSIILNFQGKFFAKRGVLSLTSADKVKLTLSLRDHMWSGFSFSTTTGTHSEASFSTVE